MIAVNIIAIGGCHLSSQLFLPFNFYHGDPMTTTISNLRNVMNGMSKNKGIPGMSSAQVALQWKDIYKRYSTKKDLLKNYELDSSSDTFLRIIAFATI